MLPVKKSDGVVFIHGLQEEKWGCGGRENSVMATMALVLRALGENYSYDYLMGISGAAFRLQISRPGICPSSPHANCGFQCTGAAIRLLPYRMENLGPRKADDPAEVRRAVAAAAKSIEEGVPVLYCVEENSLVVGYVVRNESLLIRKYCAREPGYVEEKKPPWQFSVPVIEGKPMPEQGGIYLTALKRARQLAEAERFPAPGADSFYAAGWKAWDAWIADLEDSAAIAGRDEEKRFAFQLGNGHCYYSLIDARQSAAGFCAMAAKALGGGAAGRLFAAANLYDEMVTETLSAKCPTEVAPMPWMPGGKEWNDAARAAQIEVLKKAREHDRRALAEIDLAVAEAGTP